MQRPLPLLARAVRPRAMQPVGCLLRHTTRPLPAGFTASYAPLRMTSSAAQPSTIRFSEGEDTEQVTAGLNELRQKGWQLDSDGQGIFKTYSFKTYFRAVAFVNMIAAESAAKKHHPVITVRIGSVDVHWTTHNPRGLSLKDVTLAEHCENGAGVMGAVGQGEGQKCH